MKAPAGMSAAKPRFNPSIGRSRCRRPCTTAIRLQGKAPPDVRHQMRLCE
jgi:hypothetical protein